MKVYNASQLDPRAKVVLLKDYEKLRRQLEEERTDNAEKMKEAYLNASWQP